LFFYSSLILYERFGNVISWKWTVQGEPGSIKHLIKLPSFQFAQLIGEWLQTDDDDDEVGLFILRFSSSPTSSSPPPAAAAATKTILIDQFLVIHAIAWLVVDEFDLFHLFLVVNGLQEFVADRTDFNHDL
jgi:hypothetical protein